MASLIHFNLENPEWVLPDRNTIRTTCVFQNLRNLMRTFATKRDARDWGMTALYPSREDAELNARALKILAEQKRTKPIR